MEVWLVGEAVVKLGIGIWGYTMKPVCNDHLYNEIYHLWFIQ